MAINEKLKRRLSRLLKPRFAVLYPLAAWAIICAYPSDDSLAPGLWLILPGLAVRSWANLYAVKMEKLTTCGPYAHVRHPLYLGSFLIMSGFLILLNIHWLPAALCLGVMAGIVYNITVTNEDRMLTEKFAQQYLDYKRKVPAFFPVLRPYKGGVSWRPSLERYFRSQEYKLFLWSAILIIFFYLKQKLLIEKEGFDPGKIILIAVAGFMALADAAGEFFRKKARRAMILLALAAPLIIAPVSFGEEEKQQIIDVDYLSNAVSKAYQKAVLRIDAQKTLKRSKAEEELAARLDSFLDGWISQRQLKRQAGLNAMVEQQWEKAFPEKMNYHMDYYLRGFDCALRQRDIKKSELITSPYRAEALIRETLYVEQGPLIAEPRPAYRFTASIDINIALEYDKAKGAWQASDMKERITGLDKGWPQEISEKAKMYFIPRENK